MVANGGATYLPQQTGSMELALMKVIIYKGFACLYSTLLPNGSARFSKFKVPSVRWNRLSHFTSSSF